MRTFLFLILTIVSVCSFSQRFGISYGRADSTTFIHMYYNDWKGLHKEGNKILRSGTDFPLLRLRLGYGSYVQEKYAGALAHYDKALRMNSRNQTAHIYRYYSLRYLNRREEAALEGSKLDSSIRAEDKISSFRAFETFESEVSYKINQSNDRGNGFFISSGIRSRLHYRLYLTQLISYYQQHVRIPQFYLLKNPNDITINQFQYHIKAGILPVRSLFLKTAYTVQKSDFDRLSYTNHLGYFEALYHGRSFDVSLGAYVGKISDSLRQQYDARVIWYPLGNLNLYSSSRFSVIPHSGKIQLNGSELIGLRLHKKVWLEIMGSYGSVTTFFDKDGAYIYNLLDLSKWKSGGSVLYQVNRRWGLSLNYQLERRTQLYINRDFTIHSLTLQGIWKL